MFLQFELLTCPTSYKCASRFWMQKNGQCASKCRSVAFSGGKGVSISVITRL